MNSKNKKIINQKSVILNQANYVMDSNVQKAIQVLKDGGIVIFPTDTAFGIGCRVDNTDAIRRLFTIRNRPENKAMSILVDTVTMAKQYVLEIPQKVIDQLIEPYWPGALTIILPANQKSVPDLVRGGGETVGVRIPNHPIARKLIRGVGVGILGPSANFSGEKTPYAYDDLDPKLMKLVDYVIPGECPVRLASTVIDCSERSWKVVREGAVKIQNPKSKNQSLNNEQKKVIVFIDTSSNQYISVGLQIDGKLDQVKQEIDTRKAQVVLPFLERLLSKHRLQLSDITNIEVNSGPGSFTGIRVGISIANALSFALKIPVNKKVLGEFVDPVY